MTLEYCCVSACIIFLFVFVSDHVLCEHNPSVPSEELLAGADRCMSISDSQPDGSTLAWVFVLGTVIKYYISFNSRV